MPVIVVGADTSDGMAILEGLYQPEREVRAFVSDEDIALDLKSQGFKVALGDVSDESHIEAAAMNCFSAVLIADAATDDRERSFATTPEAVLEGWARAVSGVTRVIWVSAGTVPGVGSPETTVVSPHSDSLVAEVVALDEAQEINTSP